MAGSYIRLEGAGSSHVLLEDGTGGILLETTVPVASYRTLPYGIVGKATSSRSIPYQILVPPQRISGTRRLLWGILEAPETWPDEDGMAGRFLLAFDQGALEWDEAEWTRIDAYDSLVTSYTIDRGRQYELDRTDTGRATVTIADRDGILDPRNHAGPFFGKINPLIQARLGRRNPVTGEWTTRYRGFVEEYDYQFDPSQRVNRLTISLVDQFEILSAIEMQPGRFGSGVGDDGQIQFDVAQMNGRIKKMLNDCGVEPHARVIFSGNVILHAQTYSAGESPMTVIQEAADGEYPGVSNVFCDRRGRFCVHGRFARFNPDTVAAGASVGAWDFQRWRVGDGLTVNASPTDTAHLRSFGFQRGLSKIINQATATPTGIADADVAGQLVEDTDSIVQYGIRSWSATNLLTKSSMVDGADALTETRRFASYYVQNFARPWDRVQDVTIRSMRPDDPRAAATWKLLCEADISDAAQITVHSPGGGGFVADPYFVEGVHETNLPAGPDYDDVTMTLDLSPDAFAANPWPDGRLQSKRQLRYVVGDLPYIA